MKLYESQTSETALAGLGDEAARLLSLGEYASLAGLFGYALAYSREPAAAIREDLGACLAETGATTVLPMAKNSASVKYFKPDKSALFALVECFMPTDIGAQVLMELIVTTDGSDKHLTLEQLSPVA